MSVCSFAALRKDAQALLALINTLSRREWEQKLHKIFVSDPVQGPRAVAWMLQQLLKHPKDVTAFDCAGVLARWDSEGEVDFTTLPQDTLHSLVLGFPVWHEALRHVRATTPAA